MFDDLGLFLFWSWWKPERVDVYDMNFHFLFRVSFLYKQQFMKTYILKSGEMVLNGSCSVSFLKTNSLLYVYKVFCKWRGMRDSLDFFSARELSKLLFK